MVDISVSHRLQFRCADDLGYGNIRDLVRGTSRRETVKDVRAFRLASIDRAEAGNLGNCATVGEGVSEMKIDVGPGYRVYFVRRGSQIIILLAGGDKSTQAKDIALAKKLVRQV